MANLVLKITRDEQRIAQARYLYKDIDAFSDKYAVNKVDLLVDVEAVKAAVRNIFMWNVGEEILYPQFGNNLRKYLYGQMDETTKSQIAQEVKRCVEENEKRVVIDSLSMERNDENDDHSLVKFTLMYHVIGSYTGNLQISDTITISSATNAVTQEVK